MVWFRLWLVGISSWIIFKMFQWGNSAPEFIPDDAELRGIAVMMSAVVVLFGLFASGGTLKEIYQALAEPWYTPLKRGLIRALRMVLRWLFISLPRAIWARYLAAPKALAIAGLIISVLTIVILPVGVTAFGWELPFMAAMITGVAVGMILWIPAAGILISRIGQPVTHLTLLPRSPKGYVRRGGGGNAA